MKVLTYYFITHGNSNTKELVKFLTDCIALPEIVANQKFTLSDIISELTNQDSEPIKLVSSYAKRNDALPNDIFLCISPTKNIFEHQQRLDTRVWPTANSSAEACRQPLPRAPKIIPVHRRKK